MKIVSLLSGGMDSTALLFQLLAQGNQVLPISFLYGQKHAREINAAKAIAQGLNLPHEVVNLKHLQPLFAASALTSNAPVPEGHYAEESMKATVVPNRNMVMMALAASYAITQGADAIAIAAHAGDHAVYPDCRPEFHDVMSVAFQICDYRPLKLLRPFVNITKADLVKLTHSLHVPWALTWSCYVGGEFHCGKCGTCTERKEAFELAGIPDPTYYAGTAPAEAEAAIRRSQQMGGSLIQS